MKKQLINIVFINISNKKKLKIASTMYCEANNFILKK